MRYLYQNARVWKAIWRRNSTDWIEFIRERPYLNMHVFFSWKEILSSTPFCSFRYKWYGGVVDAIYRARKSLGSPEEVKKQVSIVAYGINSATHVLELDAMN